MNNDKEVFNALLRSSMRTFVERSFLELNPGADYQHNWHIDAIIYQLQRIADGEINRLIITCPPRSLKSLTASIAFPAFLLGHNPEKKIIAASYGSDLAKQLSLDTRSVMESAWYRSAFSNTQMDAKKNTQAEIRTTKHGMRYATSVGGSLTGMGGSLIIIDDPHKPDEAQSDVKREAVHNWFSNTLLSRLNDKKKDAIIIIQQRVHEDDLAGRLLENSDDWVHLDLPAIADESQLISLGPVESLQRSPGDLLHPKREPMSVLESLKNSMGAHVFAAQYLQRPVPIGGGIIKLKDFQRHPNKYSLLPSDVIIQSWDIATSISEHADYSVGLTWIVRQNNFFLVDMIRKRLEPYRLRQVIKHAYQQWKANAVLIETSGSGEAVANDLYQPGDMNIIPIQPKIDKKSRMLAEVAAIEAHRVHIPDNSPWLVEFEYEMAKFPEGKHDDIVDSLSQFLHYARKFSYGAPAMQCKATPIYSPYYFN